MDALGILNAVFIIVALIAGGISTLLLGSVKALRDDRDDLRTRDEERRLKIAELTSQNTSLQAELAALGRQVRGEDQFASFEATLTAVVEMLKRSHLALGEHNAKLSEHNQTAQKHWAIEEDLLRRLIAGQADGGA